ncbi:MAG: L,D-transpeptidase family protein [Bacteroidales bacterium]|jgi:murein L,D-transpeptidase YcbB/YkuD|nr:L,D-transpeptidase family protein [Bacteroidales bacterium]
MKKTHLLFCSIILIVFIANGSCISKDKKHQAKNGDLHLSGAINQHSNLPFDSNLLITFYRSYPALNKYQKDVVEVYRQHHYNYIWYDKGGVVEFGQTLFNKVTELTVEGVSLKFPYQEKIDDVFDNEKENTLSQTETELMLTNLYLFYAKNVYKGISEDSTKAIGWLLPRKQISYTALLDSVMSDPELLIRDDSVLFSQYYKLRDILKRYLAIEKNGGWGLVDLDPKLKAYKPGDTAKAIRQIRKRLFITGDIKQNTESNKYDPELVEAVIKYQERNGFEPGKLILAKHIREMNVPIEERIRTIIVNMERCRWISPEFARAKEYVVINIPSFKLNLIRNGKNEFESPVIVGKNVTKTVIFSGMLRYIVFSPYWNLPQSIINKEVKPGMAKNKHYLEAHNMEWNNGQVRQKPGKNNSLGLVKFMFPNSDDIYIHDTPAKSLFAKESRAFSHGCIRMERARDFAIELLKDDPNWTPVKIDAAMHSGKESAYSLKNKIPVYIGYLTAWVDPRGEINFYKDIYKMDERLADLLIGKK